MTNKNNEAAKDAEQSESLEAVATAGMLLRTAREKKGVSIEAVAIQLHLRPSVIEDIENDNFDNISSATYARGYAKNFAKYVEADVVAIQQCLAQQLPDETAVMQSFSRKTSRDARDSRLTLVTYLIVFALLGLLLVWWIQKDSLLMTIDLSKPTAEELAEAKTPVQTEDLLEPEIDPKLAYTAPSTTEPSTTAPSMTEPSETQSNDSSQVVSSQSEIESTVDLANNVQTNATNSAALIGNDKISLNFSGDCWVNIIDAKGKTLVDGVKGSESSVEVTGWAPFKVVLGAPQVVTISFNNEDVSLAEFSNRVAKLTLPKA
ncbi:RodZ domain-containing protein [Shewanella donghaensis]|uniref:RodZ domain-containing protein n=1 Tax=Shewanella donghaensis TaxID=238836 RepID=UPI001183DBF1|nr:RodZ domain-containing protein [Shewanella donghaensis]